MDPRYFNPNFSKNNCNLCSNNMKGGAVSDTETKIIAFFKQNPYPSDAKIHKLAKTLGINKHKFEEIIYAMLTDRLK